MLPLHLYGYQAAKLACRTAIGPFSCLLNWHSMTAGGWDRYTFYRPGTTLATAADQWRPDLTA